MVLKIGLCIFDFFFFLSALFPVNYVVSKSKVD